MTLSNTKNKLASVGDMVLKTDSGSEVNTKSTNSTPLDNGWGTINVFGYFDFIQPLTDIKTIDITVVDTNTPLSLFFGESDFYQWSHTLTLTGNTMSYSFPSDGGFVNYIRIANNSHLNVNIVEAVISYTCTSPSV